MNPSIIFTRMSSNAAKYPLGTVTLYGPNDKQATKLVASILPAAHVQPSAVRKWVSRSNDIREDPSVQSELTEFLKQNSVAHAVVSEQVVGCPHEPGVDFPLGSTCPICVFWYHHRRRPTHTKPSETGRNDPCPCGSGKKLKKCCGA